MTEPRILLWDIETSPSLGYVWQKYQTDVISFKADWHLLSIAWRWLGEKTVHCSALPDYPKSYAKDPENDFQLACLAYRLFDEADIVVAHNGVAFDTKKAQARMLVHGLNPPSPFREVDTLKLARGHFAFTSNRLDDLCKTLGIGQKQATGGFGTWLGCLRGDPKAWATMKRYNKHDVVLLEELYLRLRPWDNRHPNVALIADAKDACPRCGKGPLTKRGYRSYGVTKRQRFQCSSCGGYCQSRAVIRSDVLYTP